MTTQQDIDAIRNILTGSPLAEGSMSRITIPVSRVNLAIAHLANIEAKLTKSMTDDEKTAYIGTCSSRPTRVRDHAIVSTQNAILHELAVVTFQYLREHVSEGGCFDEDDAVPIILTALKKVHGGVK